MGFSFSLLLLMLEIKTDFCFFSRLCWGWNRALQIPPSQTPQESISVISKSLHGAFYLKSSWFVQTFLFMSRGKAQFPLHLALWMYNIWIFPHPPWRILERKFSSRSFRNKTPKHCEWNISITIFFTHSLFSAQGLKSPVTILQILGGRSPREKEKLLSHLGFLLSKLNTKSRQEATHPTVWLSIHNRWGSWSPGREKRSSRCTFWQRRRLWFQSEQLEHKIIKYECKQKTVSPLRLRARQSWPNNYTFFMCW